MTTPRLTAKIVKGGALLEDTRRMVEAWDASQTTAENLERIVGENLLAKRSLIRAKEVATLVMVPRFVAPGPHIIPTLRHLLVNRTAFAAACYYEAARCDGLLTAFAEGPLWQWSLSGRARVQVTDVVDWLSEVDDRREPRWSPSLRGRVARGLVATLRDFGVLRGTRHKEMVAPDLGTAGFAYVAWREHERGASSRGLVWNPIWHLWLLDEEMVLTHFGELARLGLIGLAQAGSAIRVDWLVSGLEEVTRAVA